MAGIKLTAFKGTAPKVSPELLPDGYAQIARNCKLYSGDLIPYPRPVANGSTGQTASVQTIYPLRNPSTDALVWLSWTGEVNVATPSFPTSVGEQRFYYTGDGVPKVSTYALATSGSSSGPYPIDYYQLGLPLPEVKLTTTAASFSAKTISTVARDSGGLVTFVTSTAHGLESGMTASIKGFTYYAATYSRSGQTNTITLNNHGIADGSTVFLTKSSGSMTDGSYVTSGATANTFTVTDPESGATSGNVQISTLGYNTTASEVVKVDSTTFKLFLPGFEQSTYSVTGATVELAGTTHTRTYVYTWYTYWGEESIASEPSADLVMKEGQTVTVTDIPTAKPSDPAKNFIGGVRLYRTFAGTERGDYFLLNTLWFPQATATVARTASISTVTTAAPHNLIADDRFKLTDCTNTTFNVEGTVLDTPTAYSFTFAQALSDVTETADTTGRLFHDASENPDEDAAVFWGHTTYDFTDNFNSLYLTEALTSDEYTAPPEDLQGLKVIQNNILAGFVDNKIYMSEPGKPHAWPEAHEKIIDTNIVAIEALSGVGAIILTERHPWLLTGNDPADMALQKVDALFPCVSSRGVVPMNYGVVYPTHEGLALYSPSGPRLLTSQVYEQDTWSTDLDPTTIVAVYYGDAYFASHSEGSFIFKVEPQGQGYFVDCDQEFTAAFNDAIDNKVYFAQDTAYGSIYEWDNLAQPLQEMEWKSKVFISQDYNNLGAARVIADYSSSSVQWEAYDEDWEDAELTWDANTGVNFKLWADKTLIYDQTITDDEIFRLPSGYRSDTFEFGVEGDIRVRAIHVGQTPLDLKEV